MINPTMSSCNESQLEKSCLFKSALVTFVLLYCIWFGIMGVCAYYKDPHGLECQITQYLAFILIGTSFAILIFCLCPCYDNKEPVRRPFSSTPFSSEVTGSPKSPRLRSESLPRYHTHTKSPLRSERS